MGKVVDLNTYKAHAMERKAFGPWRRRFKMPFDQSTGIPDLPDAVLMELATPGDQSTTAFYQLIMGALGMGTGHNFQVLDTEEKMSIVDVHLFLADQVRFEMLHRLGWIQQFPCREVPLLEMVISFPRYKHACRHTSPELAESHPGYAEFQHLISKDRSSYIRRLLPAALDAFRQKIS